MESPSGRSNIRLALFSSVTDKLKIKIVGGKGYLVNLRGIICSALCHFKYWLELNETTLQMQLGATYCRIWPQKAVGNQILLQLWGDIAKRSVLIKP